MAAPTARGRTAGEQPRPRPFDTFIFAAIEDTRREVSLQHVRRLLGVGSLALQSMLDHGDLRSVGITDAVLLDASSDHVNAPACPDCGGRIVAGSDGESHSDTEPADRNRSSGSDAASQRESAGASGITDSDFDGVDDAATRSTADNSTGPNGNGESQAEDTRNDRAICQCHEPEPEPERLFEFPAPAQEETAGEELDPLGYADFLALDSVLVPVPRIVELVKAHAGDAIPAGLYEGTWQKLGMSIGHCLDVSSRAGDGLISTALTAVLGLPKLTRLARDGVIHFRKLDLPAHKGAHLTVGQLARMDEKLAALDPWMPFARYRKHALRLIAIVDHPEDQAERERQKRRVEFWPNTDGTGCLAMTGPIAEVQALYQRLHAVARAVTRNDLDAFGQQVPTGAVVADDRTLAQLVFDMLSSYTPQLEIQAVLPLGESGTGNDDRGGRGCAGGDPGIADDAGRDSVAGSDPDAMDARNLAIHGSGDPPDCPPAGSRTETELASPSEELGRTSNSRSADTEGHLVHAWGHSVCPEWRADAVKRSAEPEVGSSERSTGRSDSAVGEQPELDSRADDARLRQGRPVISETTLAAGPQGAGGPTSKGTAALISQETGVPTSAEAGEPASQGALGPTARGTFAPTASPQTVAVTLTCPTNAEWLRRQAKVALTLPALSFTGDCELPGELDDGSPIPVEVAREIAAGVPTLLRLLTDPADGHVTDDVARSYPISDRMRATVEAKWGTCAAPGCYLKAQRCELDHRIPFNRRKPAEDGRTDPANLQPLCKKHHQMKTEGKLVGYELAVGMSTSAGSSEVQSQNGSASQMVAWRLCAGMIAVTSVPGNPINVEHAAHVAELTERLSAGRGASSNVEVANGGTQAAPKNDAQYPKRSAADGPWTSGVGPDPDDPAPF